MSLPLPPTHREADVKVKAAEGLRVPHEMDPRSYIEQDPVDVDVTPYYLRRLADGDLVEVVDDEPGA
jgi:hypothetical protein